MAKAVLKKAEEPVAPKAETETTDVGASQTSSKPAVAPVFQRAKAAARPKKTAAQTKIETDDGDLEILQQSPVRKPRAASKKAPTYNLSDSESNGDDMLFDVGKMVKGIDNAPADQNAGSRPLFSSGSMPRPGSSSGLAKKTGPAAKLVVDLDDDDTDYSKLAPPQASKRGASITARSKVLPDVETDEDDNDIFPARARSSAPKASKSYKASKAAPTPPTKSQAYDTDEEDDDIFPARVPSPLPKASKISKPANQTAAKPVKAKASTTAVVKKPTQTKLTELPKVMSPAAKAYAAKRARNAAKNDVDVLNAVEKVAEEIMDEGSIIAGEDDLEEEDEDLVVRRPARKAAVQAAVKSKKSYKLDSDEDEEDEIEDDEDEEDEESEGFDEDDD